MKIVSISDTHGKWNKLTIEPCNVLISAGDFSFRGERHMVRDFHKWLDKQPAEHIISVQGNHELWVEKNFELAKQVALEVCPRVHFIDEGEVIIDGVKFYGSAVTPWFHDWAWNRARTFEEAMHRQIPEIKPHWDKIPDDVQVLITHSPAMGILDKVYDYNSGAVLQYNLGCEHLMNRILELKQLKLHVCGHIHSSSGETMFRDVKFINASICGEKYQVDYPPRVFEL